MMKDKVIIVTGASSGIGLACAREFVQRGAKVALCARDLGKLKDIERELTGKGGQVLVVKTDVSSEEDCKLLIKSAVDKFGAIDVLVNNAGMSMRALFSELDLQVLKTLMDVNFWGTIYCTKYALPYLLERKGSVVGVSSIAGFKGLPCRTGYSASKFAMNGFLETLRVENLKKGLHVLIAAPGFTASNIRKTALSSNGSMQGETPLDESKLMSAEKVAFHIANAIESRKRTLILTSLGKMTVLLNKFFPSFMDNMVYNHMAIEPDSPLK